MLFFAALLLVIARFLSVWAGTPFPIDLVTGDSMSPSLMKGDVVAWTPTTIDEVEIGDVVVFKSYVSWPGEKIVVHRVVDIEKTRSTGEPILVTKGDNNDWTDQAGPHIPEPYIREDHLMGKVVSIGQQPLKIPFVGYLGIWINDGFDMISQPSSSKESTSYIGIFLPLTISIVILVVLLFVIPEKAKTFKEKIRFNIFGRRPLKIKRTFIFFIVAYIVFLSFIHFFAYDETTASMGVNTKSETSGLDFGIVKPGTDSFYKDFDLVNPGTMPLKGVIFAKGEMKDHLVKKTFQLERGEIRTEKMQASIANGTRNGTYMSDVMVYSSPFWLMFPDDFIQSILNWNSDATVFILDLLSAIILTSITMFILISITFFTDKISTFSIDRSWRHASKTILKKRTVKKITNATRKVRRAMGRGLWWVTKLDFSQRFGKENTFTSIGKPVIAALLALPILFLITDQMTAMFIAVIITGLFAYFISCKIRRKIVLTVFITISIAITHMVIQTNLLIMSTEHTTLEILALSFGAVGIYLLILTLLLIPLSLISWILARLIRNVKERKDPLLSLEGGCDL